MIDSDRVSKSTRILINMLKKELGYTWSGIGGLINMDAKAASDYVKGYRVMSRELGERLLSMLREEKKKRNGIQPR